MATLYKCFDDIPNQSEFQRVSALCDSARAKLDHKRPDVLSDTEWNAIEILEPTTAQRARDLREQQANAQQQLQQKHAPSASAVQLARMKKGEDAHAFLERCKSAAAPVWLVNTLYKNLSDFIKQMDDRNKERNAKIAALEAKVQELEAHASQNKSLEYFGIFDGAQRYRRNAAVTFDGALWISRTDNPGVPGTDHSGWTLAVQKGKQGAHGRDGRDAR